MNEKLLLLEDEINEVQENNLTIQNEYNFTLFSELLVDTKKISNNINNIININFNNFEENQNNDTSNNYKKIFFEFLYESLKMNKNFIKLTSEVDKEEVFNSLVKKDIPFFKYFKFIKSYLRKSEPNILNNVKYI